MFISDSASDVKKTGAGGKNSGEENESVKFSIISLSIRGLTEKKPRMHASYAEDSRVLFSVKENSEMAQEQEYSFRGSVSIAKCNALLAL